MRPSRPLVKIITLLAVAGVFLGVSVVPAFSQGTAVLTFEGLQDSEQVLNYYNGGLGGSGSGPGPNFGIVFGTSALAIRSTTAGGSGNFDLNPSGSNIVYFISGPGVVMNVPAGFSTGFSFYYAAATQPGVVTVYDGLNGTGSLLATLTLPVTGASCGATTFSCWATRGVTFSGTARSVNFGGTANQIGFDNVTMGSSTPGVPAAIPVPPSLYLVATGLAAYMLSLRRRRPLRG